MAPLSRATISSFMDKGSIRKAIKAADEAAAEASETALRRARRAGRARQSARAKENHVKYRIARNAIRYTRGELTETGFKELLSEDCRELDRINDLLVEAGLRVPRLGKQLPGEGTSSEATAPARNKLRASAEQQRIDLSFLRVPPEALRSALKRELGFKYDPGTQVWSGRETPERVVEAILATGASGIVRAFCVEGRPYDFAVERS